jgi:Protein of unknown function (DUF1822)
MSHPPIEQPREIANPDWEALVQGSTELPPEQIMQAAQLSQAILDPDEQWSMYLNVLALFGFERWITERAPDLEVIYEYRSSLQPAYANWMPPACNLQVGSFTLCLNAIGSLTDTLISLPRAVLDLPPFIPHFYVLAEVL